MIARVILYVLLLAIIPVAFYFVFNDPLFVTFPFSLQQIYEERQTQIYETAVTKENTNTKEEDIKLFEEAKKFKYKFENEAGLVLIDIMELLWSEEGDLRYGIRNTPMAAPTEWIFPDQENAETVVIHHTFVWRIAVVMKGEKETIKQEIFGAEDSESGSKIGSRGEAIYLRSALDRIMGSKTVEDIISIDGKHTLKHELLEELRKVLGNEKVRSVYIDTLMFQ